MFDGKFADRQPELLDAQDWADITAALRALHSARFHLR